MRSWVLKGQVRARHKHLNDMQPVIILSSREGGWRLFWGSHGFQVNGSGFCQSQTDYKKAL